MLQFLGRTNVPGTVARAHPCIREAGIHYTCKDVAQGVAQGVHREGQHQTSADTSPQEEERMHMKTLAYIQRSLARRTSALRLTTGQVLIIAIAVSSAHRLRKFRIAFSHLG